MRIIIYAGDEYLTGDDIADALLDYSRALGDDDRAEIIEIPVRNESGEVVSAKFLIGPASQIVTEAVETPGAELVDTELVGRLRHLTASIERPTSAPLASEDVSNFEIDGAH
ncbi:hypothetical protein [Microbacterium sp. W4I20]|uniref:hypothetical protein n=1 Tax=Microbacterium sp. W4I20 TaxID=3042262 RepID=UPI00277DDDAD|nr:hypothetical protein [Microbacterium sp. W4I20]MDQ0729144.1 hypothetical protein [Microbacterium sp. W4I20]